MKELLEENDSEVENMLYTEWDWDKALDIAKEESYAVGEKQDLYVDKKRAKPMADRKRKRN